MRFIVVKNGIVRSVRFGTKAVGDEIESDIGELGQQMLDDGTFVDIEEDVGISGEVDPPAPTTEEKLLAETKYQTLLLEMATGGAF